MAWPNISKNERVIMTDSKTNNILLFLRDEMAIIRKHHITFGLAAGWPG
jgi:hypothetical protein